MADQFCFPMGNISNDILELTPFSVQQHAQDLYDLSKDHPELWAHYPQGPYETYESFLESFVNDFLAQSRQTLAFAIIDTKENTLAGVTAFVDADDTSRSVSIEILLIPAPYEETRVATHAVGLILQTAFNPPSSPDHPGMGLARVQWRLNSSNSDLIKVAANLFFTLEGTASWSRLISNGVARGKKGNGHQGPPPEEEGDVWQDIRIYSHCWDDWFKLGGGDEVLSEMDKIHTLKGLTNGILHESM